MLVSDSLFHLAVSLCCGARWRRDAVGRAWNLRSRGRGFDSRPGTRHKNSGQVSHTYVLLFTKQYKLVLAKRRWCLAAGSKGRYGSCVGGTVCHQRTHPGKTVWSPCYTRVISERFEVVVHDDKALYKYQILYFPPMLKRRSTELKKGSLCWSEWKQTSAADTHATFPNNGLHRPDRMKLLFQQYYTEWHRMQFHCRHNLHHQLTATATSAVTEDD